VKYLAGPLALLTTFTCLSWANGAQPTNPDMARYNVVWASPSKDASGQMPLGNGDVAAGVAGTLGSGRIPDAPGDLHRLLNSTSDFLARRQNLPTDSGDEPKAQTMTRITTCIVLVAALFFLAHSAHAAEIAPGADLPPELGIELGAPFFDNMVLQRGMEVPVWGWSKPGTKVAVEFAGQKKTATAGKDGQWMVELDPLKASFDPAEVVVTESTGKKIVLENILVGEVWMASGQSNMQWKVGKSNCAKLATELSAETEGRVAPIREFQASSVTSQLHPIKKATGAWQDGTCSDYSAIAFAFAHRLYKELKLKTLSRQEA